MHNRTFCGEKIRFGESSAPLPLPSIKLIKYLDNLKNKNLIISRTEH